MKKKRLMDTTLPSGKRFGDALPDEAMEAGRINIRRGIILQHFGEEILAGEKVPVKTTVRLPRSLWQAARKRAIDEEIGFQDLVVCLLAEYLHLPTDLEEQTAEEMKKAEKKAESLR